jgi:hypothetical protein
VTPVKLHALNARFPVLIGGRYVGFAFPSGPSSRDQHGAELVTEPDSIHAPELAGKAFPKGKRCALGLA